jgi:hypothetical protein
MDKIPVSSTIPVGNTQAKESPSSVYTKGRSDLTREFDRLFSSMLANTPSAGENTDGDGSDILKNKMISLLEEILAQQVGSGNGVSEAGQNPAHINQFDAELLIGGDGTNANCGPTSLVMALHSLGLKVSGENQQTSIGESVDLARKSMVVDSARDGTDGFGNRSEAEHSTFTSLDDVTRGASAAGASTRTVSPDADSIRSALLSGASVIISGTFVGKSPLPWTGDLGSDNQSPPGGATAHIVAVTGFDSKSGLFTVDDPARRTTIKVSSASIENFMSGNAGAVALFH